MMGKSASPGAGRRNVVDRVEREYRLYRIVAGEVGGVCKAVAYLGMGGVPPIETVEAPSIDEAVSRLNGVLEARLAAMRAERRNGIPTVAEFRESLAALPASVREGIRGLQIDRLNPRARTSDLATLSLRMQSDVVAFVEELRKSARRLGDLLDAEADDAGIGSDPLCLLGRVDGTDTEGAPNLRFHDEFREALASLPPERPAIMAGRR